MASRISSCPLTWLSQKHCGCARLNKPIFQFYRPIFHTSIISDSLHSGGINGTDASILAEEPAVTSSDMAM